MLLSNDPVEPSSARPDILACASGRADRLLPRLSFWAREPPGLSALGEGTGGGCVGVGSRLGDPDCDSPETRPPTADAADSRAGSTSELTASGASAIRARTRTVSTFASRSPLSSSLSFSVLARWIGECMVRLRYGDCHSPAPPAGNAVWRAIRAAHPCWHQSVRSPEPEITAIAFSSPMAAEATRAGRSARPAPSR